MTTLYPSLYPIIGWSAATLYSSLRGCLMSDLVEIGLEVLENKSKCQWTEGFIFLNNAKKKNHQKKPKLQPGYVRRSEYCTLLIKALYLIRCRHSIYVFFFIILTLFRFNKLKEKATDKNYLKLKSTFYSTVRSYFSFKMRCHFP